MKKIFVLLPFTLLFTGVYAQKPSNKNTDDFESFKKQSQQDFSDFKTKTEKEFKDFRDKSNAEFAEFMRERWEYYKTTPKIPVPVTPDPPKPPVTIPEEEIDKTPEDKPIPYDEVIPAPVVIEPPKPVVPIPEVPKTQERWFDFTVFGTACKVRLSAEHRFVLRDCEENRIADAWQTLSQPKYNNLLRDCLELRTRLNLCDWAYLQLLQQLSSDFFGQNTNEATLLTAFLYNQSGYKMRLAYSETNRLYLMISSRHVIYGIGYFQIDNDKFFPLNCTEKGLHICNKAFPKEQALSLYIGKEQQFAVAAGNKRTLTSERYPNVKVTLSSNKNLMSFFDTYPSSFINNDVTTTWAFYANTPLSQSVKADLYPVLKNAIAGKSEQDAANILINFVQTAFVYEYDDKVWGGDRPFFADETIYYPYSDCEDRAILFSRIVRDLMGLEAVLVYYPGHLATAVHFHENITGDYLSVKNTRYLVCDPTYIGANIGRTMPGMDNGKAKVVFLE